MSPRPAFHLGLVLAGAASGGAYSAGVLDFLWEALQEWEDAKARGEDVPNWSVVISDMAGTSAGALTATVSASSFNVPYTPYKTGMKKPPSQNENPMYAAWVDLPDPTQLFDVSDIDDQPDNNKTIKSLLSTKALTRISETVLPSDKIISVKSARPAFIPRNVTLTITTVNLRGVKYSLNDFQSSISPKYGYDARTHQDYQRFHFTHSDDDVVNSDGNQNSTFLSDSYEVPLDISRKTDQWKRVVNVTLASSAVPLAFPTIRVDASVSDYNTRLNTHPTWSNAILNEDKYSYAAVDGGFLNNEPFTLLERQMSQRHGRDLEADGKDAWGSVILIDPFPGLPEGNHLKENGVPLMQVLGAIFTSVRQDAMFKEREFITAFDEQAMHRFMIIPDRMRPDWQPEPLATAGLGAFAGFLDRRFREHDFQLGRRNCQKFLRDVLRVHTEKAKENEIFTGNERFMDGEYVSVIPLVGSAATEVPEPDWPELTDREVERISRNFEELVEKRADKILDVFLENTKITSRGFTLNPVKWGWNGLGWIIKQRAQSFIQEQVNTTIKESMKPFQTPM